MGSFALATDESMSSTRTPEVYWLVDDAEAAFQRMSANAEVIFPPAQKPFGVVFAIKDPDGNPRYLLQFAQNQPSQAVP